MRHEVTTRRVLYEIPGMRSVPVRDASFVAADGQPLPMRVYGDSGPVIVILEGYPDAGFEAHVGCTFMEMEWTISMAQLIAASGMRAVTHSNRDPLPDARALLRHLSRDGRVGVWSTSGHGPVAIAAATEAACAVLMNPVVGEAQPPGVPMFIARAGRDETPGLNQALDAFVQKALADNRPITLVNHADAPHSFDLFLDGPETRRILQQGLDFLRAHLG